MDQGFKLRDIIAVLALLHAGLVPAQDRGTKPVDRWYVGGAIGRGGYDADFERTKATIRTTGATTFEINANRTDSMGKAYVGYRFSPYVSLEGGYWSFGRVNISTNITSPAATFMQRRVSGTGYGADAVVWIPVNNTWSGIVRAGAMATSVKATSAEPGAGLTALPAESARKLNSHWGLGLEYRLMPSVAARFEYENVRNVGDDAKFGTADIILWTVGANYRF